MAGITTDANSECTEVNDCSCTPFEFARPRFYYGQRLGALDFSDWLWYHAGKLRFHNLHLHGSGVVCGLRAERYDIPGEDNTTVLKLSRGIALDNCGREVIVNVDQCIDVGAWFLQHQNDPDVVDWLQGDDFRLCIGLRYAECPSDPTPAPRDPCGCDAGGCEYSRVREGFELRLFTPAQMQSLISEQANGGQLQLYKDFVDLLEDNDQTSPTGDALMNAMREISTLPCVLPNADPWLWLACFEVELSAEPVRVINIDAVNNSIEQRRVLMRTVDMQSMLLALIANSMDAGEIGFGPMIAGMSFEGTGADSGSISLAINLAADETGMATVALSTATFDPGYIQLQRLDPASGWQSVNPGAGDTVEYRDSPDPHLYIEWANDLSEGMYRLSLLQPTATPIVDEKMQALRPSNYVRNFTLVDVGGTLTLENIA
jgi:hypothetical protein